MSAKPSELMITVLHAISTVDDPEYPGISIVDLGLLERCEIDDDAGTVEIGLIPTFAGCPALDVIRADVRSAVEAVAGVQELTVGWLRAPVWTTDRVSERARSALANDFTVAVQVGGEIPPCPRCGWPTEDKSLFGPSRCRSVARCHRCDETIEVLRS